jgi:hypothetical protein
LGGIEVRFIHLAFATLILSSCNETEVKLVADVESADPDLPDVKILRLYANQSAVCIRPTDISLIRHKYDPSEGVENYGSPSSKFYHGFADDEPVLIIDEDGLSFAITTKRGISGQSSIEYVSCKDLIEKRVLKVNSVKFSLN